jgi:hypothetical protein
MSFELSRLAEAQLRLEHRHADGTWGRLEARPDHTATDHDPERDWEEGRVYACPTCDEMVRVGPAVQGSDPRGR